MRVLEQGDNGNSSLPDFPFHSKSDRVSLPKIKGWCFKPEGYIVEDWYARQYAKTGGPFVPIDEKTRQVLIEGKYWVEK